MVNAARYAVLGERFAAAFRWIAALDGTQTDGRLPIDGEELFATLMSYDNKAPVNRTQESHRRYADLQVMLHGEERIQFTPAETLGAGNGYHAEKDYELFESPAEHSTCGCARGNLSFSFRGRGTNRHWRSMNRRTCARWW